MPPSQITAQGYAVDDTPGAEDLTDLQAYQRTTMGLMESAKQHLERRELESYLWMSMLRFKHELEALDD